jgi:hypothetical protein
MTLQERNAWIMAVVGTAGYGVYLAIVLSESGGRALVDVPFAAPLLWTIGGAIVASILLRILGSIFSPKGSDKQDTRDRQIYQFGQSVGSGFVVAGALAAMLMALVEWNFFWIANVIYLAFVLSAIVGSIARIISYRGEFRGW